MKGTGQKAEAGEHDEDPRVAFHKASIGREEIDAVVRVLESGWLTTGPEAAVFEEEFADHLQVGYAIVVNSCTAALHLGLEAMGIGPGDSVLTTPFTFTSTAEVVRYLGARPVFADIDPRTLNISPEEVERVLERHDDVKVILPVHYAGLSCDMGALTDIAHAHGCRILEDVAHALPASFAGRPVGQMGDAAAFSFYATKTLAVGEGGMLATDDPKIAERARMMRLHGISSDVFDRYRSDKPSWYYEVMAPGFKYNLPDIAAAIGRVQLRKIEKMRERREKIARLYNESFSTLPMMLPPGPEGGDVHAWHLYALRLDLDKLSLTRNEFIEQLAEKNISTSVHFIPLHMHPYWRDTYNLKPEQFPVATDTFNRVVSLPIYPDMTNAQIEHVVSAVVDIVGQHVS